MRGEAVRMFARTFQAEGRAGVESLSWEHAWCVQDSARRSWTRVEWVGWADRKWGLRGRPRPEQVASCHCGKDLRLFSKSIMKSLEGFKNVF